MQINIPTGNQISQITDKVIEIRVPNTKFWVLGKQKPSKLWDIYLINKETHYNKKFKTNITTKTFTTFSNIILKTPLPYKNKKASDPTIIRNFINKITK